MASLDNPCRLEGVTTSERDTQLGTLGHGTRPVTSDVPDRGLGTPVSANLSL
jgi:hypothetical protein